jgi:GDPmannose 4,6-dehydratase
MNKKSALICGASGQDGSYLAEFLLQRDYLVYGLVRRTSVNNLARLANVIDHPHFKLIDGDLSDQASLMRAVGQTKPTELYNLAAQSFVQTSWNQPELTGDITGLGVTRLLEAVRLMSPETRFYQASSSEQFGRVAETPQRETTPFYPRSPYGVAKVYGHWATVNYRESHKLFAVCGILYNHESPRRGEEFVTRKISKAVARIKLGKQRFLRLGNLEAKRDFGYAPEYVEMMWRMLQHDTPDDFVIGTGSTYRIADFMHAAFDYVGLDHKEHVEIDQRFMRPAEVDILLADATKAKQVLGWQPQTDFQQLVHIMVDADLEAETGR